jgi:hypothetical protein
MRQDWFSYEFTLVRDEYRETGPYLAEKLGFNQKLVEAKKMSRKLGLESSFLNLDERLTTHRHLS